MKSANCDRVNVELRRLPGFGVNCCERGRSRSEERRDRDIAPYQRTADLDSPVRAEINAGSEGVALGWKLEQPFGLSIEGSRVEGKQQGPGARKPRAVQGVRRSRL